MKSKAKAYYELLVANMRMTSIVFCAVIFVGGLWTFLLTRSLPALFISLAFLLFTAAHGSDARSFAVRVLAYFLVIVALIACFKL